MYKISSDDNTEYDQITGFHLGLIGGHIHLNNQWAVQPLNWFIQARGYKQGVYEQKLVIVMFLSFFSICLTMD